MKRREEPQGPPPIIVSADHYAKVESTNLSDVARLILAARKAGAPEDAYMQFGAYYSDTDRAVRVHWKTGAGETPHPESMGDRR